MAERYQVRGLRIWDSVRNTYSDLLTNIENTEGLTCDDDHLWTFKPLAEWQDENPEGNPVDKPRYQVRGRRIWDSETDTYSQLYESEQYANHVIGWLSVGGYKVVFKPLAEWQSAVLVDDKPERDDVNHPSHYTQGPIECIDAIASALGHDAFIQFLRGQVIKYMWRLGHKGDARQDAEKGTWYASRLVAELAK
jgi:hypothetical protein